MWTKAIIVAAFAKSGYYIFPTGGLAAAFKSLQSRRFTEKRGPNQEGEESGFSGKKRPNCVIQAIHGSEILPQHARKEIHLELARAA
jgi:hypothetical protein